MVTVSLLWLEFEMAVLEVAASSGRVNLGWSKSWSISACGALKVKKQLYGTTSLTSGIEIDCSPC